MRGRRGVVRVFYGRGVQIRGHEPRDVSHVDQQLGSDAVGDGPKAGEVEGARVGAGTGDDQLGLMFLGQGFDFVIVDLAGFLFHAVEGGLEQAARKIDRARCPSIWGENPAKANRS